MENPELIPCKKCGKLPEMERIRDAYGGAIEYLCKLKCPNGHSWEVGTSLDNEIEAQREAEEAWNKANAKDASAQKALLPCPFCGSKAARPFLREEYATNYFSCYVECPDCTCRLSDEAEGRLVADRVLDELVEKWNRRVPCGGGENK